MKFVCTLVIQKEGEDKNTKLARVYFANGFYGTDFYPNITWFTTVEEIEKALINDGYQVL